MADDKIELRSGKVRHSIGEIPSKIVRYGVVIITVVILGLMVGAYFIPYPETVSAKVRMANARQCTIAIPYQYVNTIAKGMTASIEFEGYDADGAVFYQRGKRGKLRKWHRHTSLCLAENIS